MSKIPDEKFKSPTDFNSDTIVVKAQIHAGGRGKVAELKFQGFDDALNNINKIMGMKLPVKLALKDKS